MADKVTLLDLSFNTADAGSGLNELIKLSLELSAKKADLTEKLKAEKKAMSDAAKALQDGVINQEQYNKVVTTSTTNIVGTTRELNTLKNAISSNNAEIKAQTTILDHGANSINGMRAQVALNTKELNKMTVEERTNTATGKNLVTQTKGITDSLKEMESAVGDNRRNVGNYAEDIVKASNEMGGLSGATGGLVKTMVGGIAGVKAFTAAMMANPFVAIATAILFVIQTVGSLMDKNNELAVSVKSILAPIQLAIAKVMDVVAALFAQVAKVFEWLSEAYLKVYNWLGLISDEAMTTIETAKGMAQVQRDIYNAESENIVLIARQRRELEKVKTIVADQTKSLKERTDAANEGIRITRKMEEAEIAVLKAKYDQIVAENSLSYTTDEDKRKELEALAALEQRQAEYEAMRRELIGQRSGFENTAIANKTASEKAAAAEATKTQKEELKKRTDAEKEEIARVNKIKESADKADADATKMINDTILKTYEQNVIEMQIRLREQSIGLVDKQKELDNQEELNKVILEKERERLNQGLIDQAEYDNIAYELKVAQLERIAAYEKEQKELAKTREATDAENRRVAAQEQGVSDFEIRKQELDEQYKQEIDNANKIGADTKLVDEKYAALRKKLKREQLNYELTMAAETAGQMADLLGRESKAGKAFAIAQATINTYQGATKALAQGGFWGIAQSAIVIATGIKQIASIAAVKADVDSSRPTVKKFAKGGQIKGASHASGGVTFTGSNGQVFEAEGGENMYVLNKKASGAINALSQLNVEYGGKSFSNSNVYKYADGGGFDVISNSSVVNLQRQSNKPVDLSPQTIALISAAIIQGVESLPNPVVSVTDINDVDERNTSVRDSALV